MSMVNSAEHPLVAVHGVARYFDVSRPWLNRVIEHAPRLLLKAVEDVSFEIRRAETLALVGESGCGKSTVARAILRLFDITAGQVVLDGRRIDNLSPGGLRSMRRRVQVVFQDPFSSLNPRMRMRDI